MKGIEGPDNLQTALTFDSGKTSRAVITLRPSRAELFTMFTGGRTTSEHHQFAM
jgi:hypothetical protein